MVLSLNVLEVRSSKSIITEKKQNSKLREEVLARLYKLVID